MNAHKDSISHYIQSTVKVTTDFISDSKDPTSL